VRWGRGGRGGGAPAVTAFESKSLSESLKEKPDDVLSTSPHSKSQAESAAAAASITWRPLGARSSDAWAWVSTRPAAAVDSCADISSRRACISCVRMERERQTSNRNGCGVLGEQGGWGGDGEEEGGWWGGGGREEGLATAGRVNESMHTTRTGPHIGGKIQNCDFCYFYLHRRVCGIRRVLQLQTIAGVTTTIYLESLHSASTVSQTALGAAFFNSCFYICRKL
jgi:hypothetical protein